MADMLQLVTSAWKVYRLIRVAAVHSSMRLQNRLQIEGGGLDPAELCVCEGCNEIHIFCDVFYVPWRSGVKVQSFSRNPRRSLELWCQALTLGYRFKLRAR